MLNTALHDDGIDTDPAAVDVRREASAAPIERHGYQAPASGRLYGGIGTTIIFAAILAGTVITLDQVDRRKPAPTTLTVTMLPDMTPKPPEPIKVELPKPAEKPVRRVEPTPAPVPIPPPLVPLPTLQAPPAITQRPAEPRPKPIEATPTPPTPAPPAGHGPDRWEGRVLARLEYFRHYPAQAQRAHQQGTAFLRFRIDRDGHVLSATIDRSSGNAALDQAALETVRKSDPLPKIPADRPDQVELVVPVEFSLPR